MRLYHGIKVVSLAALLVFVASVGLLFGQNVNRAEITGTVTDTSGAVIPGVNVTITNVLTGVSTKVTTNSSGIYDVPTLIPGTYSIEFAKTGFAPFVTTGIVLGVQVIGINAQLHVGGVSQQVTVTGGAVLVQTESAESRAVVTATALATLPNYGMTWYNYQSILPGVAPGLPTNGVTINAGTAMSVNGAAPWTTNFLINGSVGTEFDSNANPSPAGAVPMDAIQEVDVDTNSFSAQYGNMPSVANVITKTGTNQWHGSLFEFVQNTDFNARNFFAPTISPWHWNEFGGTVGGPIKRDKAFFFFTYQGLRETTSAPNYYTVATPAMQQGDFSAPGLPTVYDPASLSNGVRTPLMNNTIPQDEMSPVALKIQQYMPLPNLPGLYNNYYVNLVTPTTTSWYGGSIDYNISSKNNVSAYLMFTPYYFVFPVGLPFETTAGANLQQEESLSDTWSVSPTMINEFHVGLLHYSGRYTSSDLGKGYPQKLGLMNPQANTFPIVTIGGAVPTSIGGGAEAVEVETDLVPSDVLSIVRGKHTLKMGGEFDRMDNTETAWGNTQSADFAFGGIFTRNPANPASPGLGYADFLYGLPQTWSVTEGPMMGPRAEDGQMFMEDNYKIKSNVTLNLGLRYMIAGGWGEQFNRVASFDPSIINPETNTLGAMWFGGQQGHHNLENTDYKGFQPRVGFAWSPRNGWSIRGAYGIYDEVWAGANYSGGFGNGWETTGYETSTDLVTPIFSLSPPSAALNATYPSLSQGPPLPSFPPPHGAPSAAFLNGTPVTYIPFNSRIPYIQQAHFDVQHQFPHGIFVDAGYVWTRGIHLSYWYNFDQVPPNLLGPGNAILNTPYPQYDGVNGNGEDGYSNYNSFQLTVKRNFSHGLMFAVNYTWSKALDTETVSNYYGGDSGLVQNSYDLRANYGLGNMDMPQIFNAYFIYQLPFGSGKHFLNRTGVVNGVIGGWQLSSIITAHSGSPFTPTMGTANLSGSLENYWYPNRVASGTVPNPTINGWFNTAAFVEPVANTFGNSGRNVLLGPGYKDFDFSLAKGFPIRKLGEGGRLEFRVDAIDAFNLSNWGQPDSSIGTDGVGVITSSITNRELQLGIHLTF